MTIRHYRNGIEVGTIAGAEVNADQHPTIKAVIEAINERNENNVRTFERQRMART